MATAYDQGPEVAPPSLPEATHSGHASHASAGTNPLTQHAPTRVGSGGSPVYSYPHTASPIKPEQAMYSHHSRVGSPYNNSSHPGALAAGAAAGSSMTDPSGLHRRRHSMFHDDDDHRRVCGCAPLVFLLSCIVALLSVAVIGLAAGTGIEANRANEAQSKLAVLQGSATGGNGGSPTVTVTAINPTATSFNDLDNGCTNNPDSVSGTFYQAFSKFGGARFTMFCNKDAVGVDLYSLFASDFNTCMDACASYSQYTPKLWGNSSTNATCGSVSFIPLWTAKATASAGNAPGNCYLKPVNLNGTSLKTPNIGTECHAAVLNRGT